MSKADEMFNELGYVIQKDDGKVISYEKISSTIWDKPAIFFDRITRFVKFFDIEMLSMREWQAINEKVKELGWLDE